MTRKYIRRSEARIAATEPHVRALFKHMDIRKITLREAGEKSGVDERVISDWRRGKSTPRLDLFASVCDAVGICITLASGVRRVKIVDDQLELTL